MTRTRSKNTPILRAEILAAMESIGTQGALTTEICALIGRAAEGVATNLTVLTAEGIVGWWPDPIGRCVNRRRWWLIQHRPSRKPQPSGLRSIDHQTQGLSWRTRKPGLPERPAIPQWTHDKRYQLPPGTRINGPFTALGIGRYLQE